MTLRRLFLVAALAFAASGVGAQAPAPALPDVTVSGKANPDPVEKSYRRMLRGMDLFERLRGMAPQAQLRYKLLPRKRDSSLADLELYVLGTTVELPIAIAPDRTFTLERNGKAVAENAVVSSDRKSLTMTWRADIRTPGLPPDTRRLGDLRLECQVGMEAGLVSNTGSAITRMFNAMLDTPAYCERSTNRYLFFADRPVFGVTLVHGARREMLAIGRLYAAAFDDANLKAELHLCDCEVLLDRTYYMPLADRSWPDDTLVLFDYMDD